jgi:hypothetical protein
MAHKTPWIVNDSNRKFAVAEYICALTRYKHNKVTQEEVKEMIEAANHLNLASLRNETAMINYIVDRCEKEDPSAPLTWEEK